jgi:hypothetical protein
MAQLVAPGCSIQKTPRHRFFWAAWWTAAPCHVPFRKPDASGGGAPSFDDARRAAEQAAGRPLVLLDPLWARAWNRILRGEDPWPTLASREPREVRRSSEPVPPSVWSILGVEHGVSPEELKAAYRRRVLEAHPDQGGQAEELRMILGAYKEASRRLRHRCHS